MTNLAKQLPTMSKARSLTVVHNALSKPGPKPAYYLEDFDVHADGTIGVVYMDRALIKANKYTDADWREGVIAQGKLTDFVLNHYRNVIDAVNSRGEHIQFELDTDVTIYMLENLRPILLDYLNAGKEVLPC